MYSVPQMSSDLEPVPILRHRHRPADLGEGATKFDGSVALPSFEDVALGLLQGAISPESRPMAQEIEVNIEVVDGRQAGRSQTDDGHHRIGTWSNFRRTQDPQPRAASGCAPKPRDLTTLTSAIVQPHGFPLRRSPTLYFFISAPTMEVEKRRGMISRIRPLRRFKMPGTTMGLRRNMAATLISATRSADMDIHFMRLVFSW